MSEHVWVARLSEYVDGELGARERQELEAHLAGCADCSSIVEELRRVVAQAAALGDRPPRPPVDDLWSGIAERIAAAPAAGGQVFDLESRRRGKGGRDRVLVERRFSFSLLQLVAASVVLVILSGGSAWLATRSGAPAAGVFAISERDPSELVARPVSSSYADEKFGTAIAELRRVLDESGPRLDPATVRTIEENLRTINRAIGQARRALAEDPASEYLNDYLAKTMQQKLEFLRETTSLVAAS